MARKTRTIDSMEELFEAVPEVFEAINADPALAMRFAVNSLFLAEEMGYKLSDEMKHFAARRVRFSTETFERMVELEAQIWEHAGERFDIDSGEALSDLRFPYEFLVEFTDQSPGLVMTKMKITAVRDHASGKE